MHILPEELKRPTKDRNSAEKAFKWINKTITAVQLGCLLLSIANVSIATNKTIDTDMWGINQGITITQGVVAKITNCTLSRSTTIGASTGTPTVMSLSNVYVYLAQLMFDLKAMIGVVAACIFLGAINKLLFDFNTYRLTYGEIIFRKDVISTLDVGFHIFGIVLVAGTATSASDLKAYFDACGVVGQNTLPYTPPFPELYVALVLGLFGNIVCATAHLIVSQRKVVEDSAPQDTVSYPETFAAPQPQQQTLPRRANQAPPQRATYAPDRYTSGDDELRTLGATQQGLYSANGSPRRNLRAPPSTGSNRGRDQSSY